MVKIQSVKAREILDSRDDPTVEVELVLQDGSFGRASVPSGASTGAYEAVELRDNETRYGGKGVMRAVGHVNTEIAHAVVGKDFDQRTFDLNLIQLDGTSNKARFGANAILGVSMAFARASAESMKMPLYRYFQEMHGHSVLELPVPLMNVLNGGKHALNSTDIQEFMIVPLGAPNVREAIRYGDEIFDALRKILFGLNLNTAVGDEGGFAPALPTNERGMELLLQAIQEAHYVPGRDVAIAIDVAASELFHEDKYQFTTEGRSLSSLEMMDLYAEWISRYPLVSLEDGLHEDDWEGWEVLTRKFGDKVQIVGDDFFVTNVERLRKGIERKAANSILVKLNQIGTVSETIDAVRMAQESGFTAVISHRSGETEDVMIADLAVGVGAGQIKTGSPCRGERVAKYNQLLRIEEELGSGAVFAGKKAFKSFSF